jgi:glycosyltransferase involved in cell wall biosynthesis
VKKHHILFVRRTFGFGGVESRLIEWLKWIDYNRISISILTHKDVFTTAFSKLGLPVNVIVWNQGIDPTPANVIGWYKMLRKISPGSIVLMQGDFFDIPLFLVVISKILKTGTLVITEHLAAPEPPRKTSRKHFKAIPGMGLWWYRAVWPRGMRGKLPDKIVAVSNGVRKKLILWGYPDENISVIHHGVDSNQFYPSMEKRRSIRESLGIPADAVVVVSTARFEPQKRIDRLVDAYNSLIQDRNDLWLILIGDGSLRGEIEKRLLCRDRVVFLGLIDREELADFLRGSDIFVLPSDNEGFGIALIEAMATGLLCIATNVAGPDEIIVDGENGFLVENSNESILKILRFVMDLDPNIRDKISTNARETVIKRFDIEDEVERMFEVLKLSKTSTRNLSHIC